MSEFKCKCGDSHDTKLDTILADKFEKLHKALNCSKIIINSVYRCSSHDRNPGGSGVTLYPDFAVNNRDLLSFIYMETFWISKVFRKMKSGVIACINTNRNFIGIELSDDYFRIAQNRIRTEN